MFFERQIVFNSFTISEWLFDNYLLTKYPLVSLVQVLTQSGDDTTAAEQLLAGMRCMGSREALDGTGRDREDVEGMEIARMGR